LVGLAALLYQCLSGRLDDRYLAGRGALASAAALMISASIFPMFFWAWEPRHLVEASPAFLLLAGFGCGWIASWPIFRNLAPAGRWTLLIVAALITIGWNLRYQPQQHAVGYRQLTQAVVESSFGPARTILISGDSIAEGAFISEIAQREPHPSRYVVRGTKLFADIGWMGKVREMRVKDASQMDAFVTSLPIDLVVIDLSSAPSFAYQPLLEQAIGQHPERWQRIASSASLQRFAIFRRQPPQEFSASQIVSQLQAVLPEPVP
jgi:hypothetical protein